MKKLFSSLNLVALLLTFIISSASQADQKQSVLIPYYGQQFFQDLKNGTRNEDLKKELRTILRSTHQKVQDSYDVISNNCQGSNCYQHKVLGYYAARVFLFGQYYLKQDKSGYSVHDFYCDRDVSSDEFKGGRPGPGQIPDDKVVNTEHTWPQSRFNGRFDKEEQKSDLHHLYPTDSQLNGIRGNNEFGEVVKDTVQLKCPASRYGLPAHGTEDVFEPPQDHKGEVARALMYFSIRYDLPISKDEEETLKRWNKENPVTDEERNRNEEVFKIQSSRNPFVDYPELGEMISDF